MRWATAFFITRADFTTWGRNIFPDPNKVPDDVHSVHQRPFDHVDRALGGLARLLRIADHEGVDALHQRMFEPLGDRPSAPFGLRLLSDRI
jgi:hypothetical protein